MISLTMIRPALTRRHGLALLLLLAWSFCFGVEAWAHNVADAQRPDVDDLPTSRQLAKATLVAVILPAEYAIDPTGAGRVLGLTRMGEVKRVV